MNEYILLTTCPVCGKRVTIRTAEWLGEARKKIEAEAAKECGCKAEVTNEPKNIAVDKRV